MAEKQPSAAASAPLPPIYRRWMRWGLLVGVLAGAPGGLLYYRYHEQHERSPPRVNICFSAYGGRLRRPVLVSPSEPYTLRDGQTYYLTDAQARAAGCAASLPGEVDEALVKIWAIEDQEARAQALGKMVLDLPADPAYDNQVFSLWRLVTGSLESMDKSDTRDTIKKDVDQAIACRFNHPALPACPSRPPLPVFAIGLAGVGAAGLLAVLVGLAINGVRHLVTRRAQKRAASASASVAAP